MLLFLVSSALLSLVPVNAGVAHNRSDSTQRSTFNNAVGGPFDLNDVYKPGTNWVSGFYSKNDPNKDYAPAVSGDISFNRNYYVFAGNGLPLHVIYFGNAGFTDTRKALVQNYLNNIADTGYWSNFAASINYHPDKLAAGGTWNIATPNLGQITNIPCGGSNPISCNIGQFSEEVIVARAISNLGLNPTNSYSVFNIIGGTDVFYYINNVAIGDNPSPICGVHGTVRDVQRLQSYTYTQLLRSSDSWCNTIGKLVGTTTYPNNDFAIDNAITILNHELLESIISPSIKYNNWALGNNGGRFADGSGGAFEDSNGKQSADKCSNIFLDVDPILNNANIRIGSYNYLIFPMYDYSSKKCSMGAIQGYCRRCNVGASIFSGRNYDGSNPSMAIRSNGLNTLHRGGFSLKMQSDGNLVLSQGGVAKHSTRTSTSSPASFYRLSLGTDGRLGIYNDAWSVVKMANNVAQPANNYCAVMQPNDGNFVIYGPDCVGDIWSTNGSGKGIFLNN